jgi:hypothetical protein
MARKKKIIRIKDSSITINYSDRFDYSIVRQNIARSFKKARSFLQNLETKPVNITVVLAYTRKEFDVIIKRKTESWVSGNTFRNGDILIFHPDVFETETSHKKEGFGQTLTHEFTHVLSNSVNPHSLYWISEGIAQVSAKQSSKNKFIKEENIKNFIKKHLCINSNYEDFQRHEGYQTSYWLTKYILGKYGREHIVTLVNTTPKNFKDQYRKIFGKTLKELKEEIYIAATHIK